MARRGRGLRETVLIADSDVERGQRLAAACGERGIDVAVATHGARALEIALARTPVAMVAQLDLPLIDGERLSEILRANPRTRAIGILFVGDANDAARRPNATDSVIPGHADPETTVHFIEALLHKRRSPRADDDESGGIEGELAQVALSELIDLFHVNRKTGSVTLTRGSGRRRERGSVELREGEVVHATAGAVQGEKALYRLLAWDRGRFAFQPGPPGEETSIERPTRTLLREGRRQAAEWDRLVLDLPPDRARVRLKVTREALPSVLHPLTQEVLMVLDHSDRVADVLDRCSFPDYQVLRTLATMHRRGLVELRHEAPGSVDAAGLLPVPAPVAMRLRERLAPGLPGAPLDTKVLVIGAGEDAIRSLCALLARLPGAEIHAPGRPSRCAGSLGRLAVDDEVGVEWLSVPGSPRFAPVWPLAAHGATAVLFAHAGPIEESAEQLRTAVDEISQLPRCRPFHALLSDKPSPSAAAALADALGLFDDRGVVEIPLAKPETALAALRELLPRLLA